MTMYEQLREMRIVTTEGEIVTRFKCKVYDWNRRSLTQRPSLDSMWFDVDAEMGRPSVMVRSDKIVSIEETVIEEVVKDD